MNQALYAHMNNKRKKKKKRKKKELDLNTKANRKQGSMGAIGSGILRQKERSLSGAEMEDDFKPCRILCEQP
jgi:hypothetical protein